jgi:hypothetical protein
MELERSLTAVIPAEPALATRLLHQNSLDSSAPSRHPLLTAALAAIATPSLEAEGGYAVSLAPQLYDRRGGAWVDPVQAAIDSLDRPPTKAVPNRGHGAIQLASDLGKSGASGGELLEPRAVRSPSGGETVGARCSEAVLPCPVCDRGAVAPGLASYDFEGFPRAELRIEPSTVHERMFARGADGRSQAVRSAGTRPAGGYAVARSGRRGPGDGL